MSPVKPRWQRMRDNYHTDTPREAGWDAAADWLRYLGFHDAAEALEKGKV